MLLQAAIFPDTWVQNFLTAEDLVTVLIIVVILALFYWRCFIQVRSGGVPEEFWYIVPQSTTHAKLLEQNGNRRSIKDIFVSEKLDLVVFWGSQSGRAEIISRQFGKSLQDLYGLRVLATDLEELDVHDLAALDDTQRVAFILSTYGDGDPPDNTDKLWSFLHEAEGKSSLNSLRYLIFGLGNSNYRQYNHFARVVDERLQALGAIRLCHAGVGDDAKGSTESDFLAWRREVESELKSLMNLIDRKQTYQPAFTITEDPSINPNLIHWGEPLSNKARQGAQRRAVTTSVTIAAPVIQIKKLWETSERSCVQVDIDLGSDRSLKYKTGDHFSILACNPEHEVDQLLKCLGLGSRKHVPIRVDSIHGYNNVPIPTPTTVDALFRNYMEICGPIPLDTIGALIEFAPSDTARQWLVQIYNNVESFTSTIRSRHMTLGGLLSEIGGDHQWEIPLSFFLERLKPMQPRSYSIASSAVVQPQIASIVAVIDKPPSKSAECQTLSNGCYGLATSYLYALEQAMNRRNGSLVSQLPTYRLDGPQGLLKDGKIFCSVSQSSFRLPSKASLPIIMVGAGTGVAPFRGFVQERLQRLEFGEKVGKTLLFMGFRDSQTDYIYSDQWARWQQVGVPGIFQFWTAFSRDKGTKRQYVQDLVKAHGQEILGLLNVAGCRLYICGSASMARGVVETLLELRMTQAGGDKTIAVQWIRDLRRFGILLEDVWG